MKTRSESAWVRRLRFYFTESQFDRIMHLPDDHWQWKVRQKVEDVFLFIECKILGHKVVDDQCGIPAHRYCVICMKAKPNQPEYKWSP